MAQRAVGTKLQIGAASIAELSEIGGLDLSADTIDTTALDSVGGYRQFIGGFKDGGEVSISGFFNPSDPGQAAIYTAFQNGTVDSYVILFPFGASWSFNAVVTGFKTNAALEDAVGFEGTIKVSGQPTLNLSASGSPSSISFTGTAGALSPTFAGGTTVYAYTFTGASITATVTFPGSATYDVYVDGALAQANIAAGTPSSAIAFGAVGSKKITIFVRETAKSPKIYEFAAIRTA